jgi:uncharacterized protein YndB with AHSA1/START domain
MTRDAVSEIAGESSTLVLAGKFPGISPDGLYKCWTDPELLCGWWPQDANLDVREGGEYCLRWPGMGWVLRGCYTEVEEPHALSFTWRWDHEPEKPERQVRVSFEQIPGGTRLLLQHGTYAATPADQEERQGHLDGWMHFLGRLRQGVNEA